MEGRLLGELGCGYTSHKDAWLDGWNFNWIEAQDCT